MLSEKRTWGHYSELPIREENHEISIHSYSLTKNRLDLSTKIKKLNDFSVCFTQVISTMHK